MRKIHLHGALGKKYGVLYELEVATAGEAIRALSANLPGFMMDIREGAWHVVRGDDVDHGLDLGEDDIGTFKLGRGDLHIVPHVAGSKRGGLLKIILGVALVGAAFAFSGGALATPIMGGALAGATYGNMAMIGVALALAGVSSMLSPQEKDESGKNDSSFTMSGPGNSYEQGSPIPLVYGEVITGGVLVSGGIDVEQIEVDD